MKMKLNVRDNQAAFNKVCRNLAAMKERSYNIDKGGCLYRNGKNRCAIGGLINDNDYLTAFEKKNVASFEVVPSKLNKSLLSVLQNAHDWHGHWNDKGFTGWPQLADIAYKYQLKTNVLNKVRTDK
jgi:hypothetical protein